MPSDITVRPGVTEAVVVREEWTGAADRGLRARQEREKIVASVLKDGPDFGIIPGTKKATLLKPGAEKIVDSLNLYPDYEPVQTVEDFDKPLIHYRYRCTLKARGTDAIVSTGIGSCNSMESRYRWRDGKKKCPKCQQETIFKSKEEGKGWYCWSKKGGCGTTFKEADQSVAGQKSGRVLNDDIHSQVNTIDKMAQKRSLVAAALNLGFSEQFTQDLEDGSGEPDHVDADVPREIHRDPVRQAQPPQEDALGLPPDEPGAHDGPEPEYHVDTERQKLWAELKEMTGGVEADASKLLMEITSGKNFKGFQTTAGIKEKWQVENARKRLAEHPIFGDKRP
jgi:hypothetical protein